MSNRGSFIRRLWQRLRVDPPGAGERALLADRAALFERLDAIEARLLEMATRQVEPATADDRIPQALATLEKQIGRAGREQLKTNALVEAQLEQLRTALDLLRGADQRREADLAALRAASQRPDGQVLARALLPAIDGLDHALSSGGAVLARHTPPAVPPTIVARMRAQTPLPQHENSALRDALAGWLRGIELVRQRLLDLLAAEGIEPIPTLGQPFDPVVHVAVEVVPPTESLPPGMVAREVRRGYTLDGQVFRLAEVAVTREAIAVSA